MKNIHILPTDKPSRLYLGDNGNFVFGMLQNSIQSKNDNFTNQNIYITSDEEIKEGDWVIKKYETKFPESNANEVLQVNKINTNNGYLPNGNYYNFSNYLTVVVYDRPFQGSNDNDISRKSFNNGFKKIILTTDPSLDGVQAIDDEFLEWFVKNPSCEVVEVKQCKTPLDCGKTYNEELTTQTIKCSKCGVVSTYPFEDDDHYCPSYKIIIPKEEPKQDLEKEMFDLEQELDIPSNLRFHNSKPKQETLEEAVNNFKKTDVYITEIKQAQERMYSDENMRKAFCAGFASNVTSSINDAFEKWFEQFKKR